MSGMSKANQRQSRKSDRTRRPLSLPAKAGKRRPPHLKAVWKKETYRGVSKMKRHYEATNIQQEA